MPIKIKNANKLPQNDVSLLGQRINLLPLWHKIGYFIACHLSRRSYRLKVRR